MKQTKPRPRSLGEKLRQQGFDLTRYVRAQAGRSGYYRPKCGCCEVLVINGTACHETGCPNERKEGND